MLNDIALLYTDNDRSLTVFHYGDGHTECLNMPAESILENWCICNGSTVKGRIDAFRKLTGVRTKSPVLIREQDLLLFFPLRSISASGENYWINDNLLAAVIPHGRAETKLIFISGFQMTIPYDSRIIRRERDLCRVFRTQLIEAEKTI